MEWLQRMNSAMDYIESHLLDKIDYAEVAKKACCSVFHFQRMFSFITDIPLSEYVRRRKLTMAAFELQNTDIKIIDLSLKYGYNSPEAFARAFQNIHGIPPTAARELGANLKAYPRLVFQITMKGDKAMNYRIEKKKTFSVYGIEGIFDTENGENLKAIPDFWTEKLQNGEYERLVQSTNQNWKDKYGLGAINAICDYYKMEGTKFPYMLFTMKTPECDATGYKIIEIPDTLWAIFKSEEHTVEETSSVLQNLSKRVYTDWLPTADYEKIDGYELEMYYNHGNGKCSCEVWIRVKPKNKAAENHQ